jgi:hypothetical protein
MDLRQGLCFFRFDSSNKLPLVGLESSAAIMTVSAPEGWGPDLDHLAALHALKITDLASEFSDVLTSRLELTTTFEYDIQLLEPIPVKLSPCRLMPPKRAILHQQIQKMLDQGIIRSSTSEYSSSTFLVPKRDCDFRPVVDYRSLNQKIKTESIS